MTYRLGVDVGGARRYGVVVTAGGQVDADATAALRAGLAAGQQERLPIFNMGPPLEQILARCEEETGPPAPKRPVAL